ncbi:hypothetical protein CVT24_008921 [Panaeolus cyanescens]|uniref:Mitotic checkpoint regulator, MAD2B-interacting-domain-containing protein n=1 Tax=Panaeolus cyanescens TaxID=181874 RepID=A0A409VB00_9AGAR|nr:hypothetical protein CVT24_008921 [Panaeolus cyanescens]
MLGIEDYGSDSDNEVTKPAASKPSVKPKTKKIAIALPSLPKSADKEDAEDEGPQDERPAKRMKTGAGASSLLSMLPKPKQSSSFALPPPKSQSYSQPKSLGGGGIGEASEMAPVTPQDPLHPPADDDEENTKPSAPAATMFMPTSLGKGKKNISLEEGPSRLPAKPATKPALPAVDFFSLESTSSSSKPTLSTTTSSSTSLPNSTPSISLSVPSAAPDLPTFEPPEPTPTDPYPGYYQLPSGQWAAHDVEYYNKFLVKWQKEYDAHVRSLEKGTVKGFEGLHDSIEEVNALKEMEKARKEIQEREEKKAVTTAKGEPAKPRMNINASKLSGIARSRHQLSTLLKEAYENREALEERIAQGKRNRKEAGNKYGF